MKSIYLSIYLSIYSTRYTNKSRLNRIGTRVWIRPLTDRPAVERDSAQPQVPAFATLHMYGSTHCSLCRPSGRRRLN